jgi:hypothetical protein
MHAREWSLRQRPRIITKFFGAEGAFVGDYEGAYFAVMGHVWTLKSRVDIGAGLSDDDAPTEQLEERDFLAAFVGLCNSSVFVKLLSLYAPHVAGGQFDLSARHVAPIPIPDIQVLSLDPSIGRAIRTLGFLGRNVDVGSSDWNRKALDAASYLYGDVDLDTL